jgi:Protein of unknown function (DUF1579)
VKTRKKTPASAANPRKEAERLAYFAGRWLHEGEMKSGAFGPGDSGGRFTYTETCQWFAGNFAIVGRSEGKTPEGLMNGLSVTTWDAGEKTYIYFETNSMGEIFLSRGKVRGNRWTWHNASKRIINGKAVRTRLTLRQASPDSATYKFEMGARGKQMKVVMEGRQTRLK